MNRYSIILLAALAIAGCTETEEFQGNPDSALQIESVSGISPFALMQDPSTRAVITDKSLPGDEAAKGIGLFVTASNGGAYDDKTSGYSNVKYTYNASKWNTATPVYLSNTTGKLYGYFPYSAGATNLTAVPVESSLNGTDYLYATPQDVSFSNKSVNLTMNHALARLHLTIKKGDKYLSGCNLTKIVLKSKAIDANGTMNITTGAVTATKGADETGTVTLTGTDVSGAVTAAGITKDILLVPADNSEGKKDLTLTLTIDGVDATVNFTGENGLDIRPGIQNNVTLTIEDTGIKVTGIGVGVWGDGGGQTVEVSGYKVTVKLDEGQSELADDIVFTPNIKDGSEIKIVAISLSQKRLECHMEGNASCNTEKKQIEGGSALFNFTISDITSDVTATIGYPRPAEIKISESSLIVYVGESYNLIATVLPDDTYNKKVTWSSSDNSVATVDNNGKVTAEAAGTADIIATTEVGGITATCKVSVKSTEELILPGEFSVGSTNKVRFSRGNLYYDGNSFCIEEHQYDTTPSSDGYSDNNHISHFMWCRTAEKAMALKYDTSWDGETPFFAASGFKVYSYSNWRVLTGDNNGEWSYLLNSRSTAYGIGTETENRRYAAVKVNNIEGLLIFPDVFSSWPSGAGNEPQTFNTNSSNWNDKNYTVAEFQVLQDNGCVFLPAAGYRYGDSSSLYPAYVGLVGYYGCYWSASPDGNTNAFDLSFGGDNVDPSGGSTRDRAFSVRLVTECQ